MKSKITKIQNLLMKGIAIIISAMMSITPIAYAATNLNDNGDFDLSIIDQILYGKVGATAKEIEKYFAEGHTTLYISSEVQLRALAEYVNSAHPGQNKDLGDGLTCNGDHSCNGKEIILTKNIDLSDEEWDPIGKVLSTTAEQSSTSSNNSSNNTNPSVSESDSEGAIINEELENDIDENIVNYQPEEDESQQVITEHTEEDELIANELFSVSEDIIITSTSFEGTFNGNGFIISNLKYSKINKSYKELNYIGLFGVTGKNAIIKNLTTRNFNIDLPWEERDLYLTNNNNNTAVCYYSHAGNIAGLNHGIIENCVNESNIYGGSHVGGICGRSTGIIKNCKNTGDVSGYKIVGGITGYTDGGYKEEFLNTYKGYIENCKNTGKIYGRETSIGGIAGYGSNDFKITNSINEGKVYTEDRQTSEDVISVKGVSLKVYHGYVGGIIGRAVCQTNLDLDNSYPTNKISTIKNCINVAEISGYQFTGGISGVVTNTNIEECNNNGNVKGQYSTAGITGKAEHSTVKSVSNNVSINGKRYTGGIAGYVSDTTINDAFNNGDATKQIYGSENYVGGIAGYVINSVVRNSANRMPIRGYSCVGGIIGILRKSNAYYVYNMDSISTDDIGGSDVIGVEYVGGLIGSLQESSLRRSASTAEVTGVKKCIGGAIGIINKGTEYSNELYDISKVAVLGKTKLDIDHWTYESSTNGTYSNENNPVVKSLSNTGSCYAVAALVGYINLEEEGKTTTISNCYLFGNVIGMQSTGSTVGHIYSGNGKLDISGIKRDEKFTYVLSKVNTTSDIRQFKISLKGDKNDDGTVTTTSTSSLSIKDKSTGAVTSVNINNASSLSYGLKYTGLMYGYNGNNNTNGSQVKSFSKTVGVYDNHEFGTGTTYDNTSIENGIYGVEFITDRNDANSSFYNFKVHASVAWDATYMVLPIVDSNNNLVNEKIGSDLSGISVGKIDNQVINVEGTVGNYKVNYKLYRNNTEMTGETYLRSGDRLKVTATINAPIVNMIDNSNNLTKLTRETAPTLKLKNGNTVVATVEPNTVSTVTASSTQTTFTYEYDITEETSNQGKINKVSLNKVGTLYIVGTTSQITNSSFGEAETMDLLFDNEAPNIITNMYVEHPLETNRYTAGKEILFKATTSERIYGNYVLPELRVRFSKSGIGKYMYSNETGVGYAKPISSIIKVDGKTEWIYSYIIQEGDEGNIIAEYTKGTIEDRAGNRTYIQDRYVVREPSSQFNGTNQFGSEFEIADIGFYKDISCTQEINFNRYQIGDIYVKVELDDTLYAGIGEVINTENAPKLYLNGDIGTEVVGTSNGKTIIYKYNKSSVSNITLVKYITIKNEIVNLYYGQTTTEEEIGTNKIYQIDVDDIYLDPNNVYGEINENAIYADTTAPTVKIIPLDSRFDFNGDGKIDDSDVVEIRNYIAGLSVRYPERIKDYGDIDHDGEVSIIDATDLIRMLMGLDEGINITNTDKVKYMFIWSENVVDFTEDSIVVNGGSKGQFARINNNVYTIDVETLTQGGNTKELQLIVEQDSVHDLAYQGNVRQENIIQVDKKAPIIQNYSVNKTNETIIVEAIYNEAIASISNKPLEVKFGNINGYGSVESEISGNKVTYTYTILGSDDGKAEIKIVDRPTDIVGNTADNINAIIENDITLHKSVIRVGDDEYGFDFIDFSKDHYYKEGDIVTVIKDGVIYKYTVSGEYANNTQMKSMKLNLEEGQTQGIAEFSSNSNLEIDITSANIYFDTTKPIVTTEVQAVNPRDGVYTTGEELRIIATSSEEVEVYDYFIPMRHSIVPRIKVGFGENEGKFYYGLAQFVEEKINENGTTSWIYRYVISEGDEGDISLSYDYGEVIDKAGNSIDLTELNDEENIFIIRDRAIIADTTLPTVGITAKKKENNTKTAINGNVTNANVIEYTFTWSEEIVGFTAEDITVNNGSKGTLSEPTRNSDGTVTYTMDITTSVENGNTGDIQVIVEKDAAKDRVGLGNIRTESVIRVDKQAPILVSLEAFAESNIKVSTDVDSVKQYYKAGEQVTIVATFNENVIASELPKLAIEFSESGNAKNTVSDGVIEGNKITYTYVIKNGDNGRLSVKGFSGSVKDPAGNETIVTMRILEGDTVIADTVNPTLVSLTAIAPDFEYDEFVDDTVRYGIESKTRNTNTITIIATYSENIYNLSSNNINNITNSNAPTLKLKFGTSTERTATFQKVEGDKIYYTYDIRSGDNGELTITSLDGTVSDLAGNKLTLTTNTSLPILTEYIEETKLEENNHIVADTTKPSYTMEVTEAIDKDDNGNKIEGNTSENIDYFREGSVITVTTTSNKYVYKNTNRDLTQFRTEDAPELTVKFGNAAGKGNNGKAVCKDVNYSGNNTVFTYEYTVADQDNGELTVSIAENSSYDIALNGNNVKIHTFADIVADTERPYIVENTDRVSQFEISGTSSSITATGIFSEQLYVKDANNNLTKLTRVSDTPKMGVIADGKLVGTATASISTVNGVTKLVYTYNTSAIDAQNVSVNIIEGTLYDVAGNEWSLDVKADYASPKFSEIQVLIPDGYYNKDKTLEFAVKFVEQTKLTTVPTLKIKIGDKTIDLTGTVNEEDELNQSLIKVARYSYKIIDENGPVTIVSLIGSASDGARSSTVNEEYTGTNEKIKDCTGNIFVNTEESKVIVDTTHPTVEITSDVEKTNKNKVVYTFTWSEPVSGFNTDDIEVINGVKSKFTGENGDKVYTLEVNSAQEGRQIVNVRENACVDRAGNNNAEDETYNNVAIDYTKPEIRAKINGGKFVINTDPVPDTEKRVSKLKETIVVNEEISEFKYTWYGPVSGELPETAPTSGWTTLNAENIGINSDIPLEFTAEQSGTYYLYIKATDIAGNTFTGRTNGFFVSNTNIIFKDENNNIINSETEIPATNKDVVVNVEYQSETTGLSENKRAGVQGISQSADPTKVIITENGIVYAEATDINGNKVYAILEVKNIDKTAPVINATLDEKTITINSKDTDIDKYIVTTTSDIPEINDNGWQQENTKTLTEDGTYYVWAKDKAGNISEAKMVVIDTTAPIINISVEGRKIELVSNENDCKYIVTTTDEIPEANAEGWQNYNIIRVTEDGTYYVWAKDKAGNISEAKIVVIDTTVPTADITYVTNEDGTVTVTISFNEENVTVTNNEGNTTYTFEGNGEFTFEFVDEAGNRGTAKATVTSIHKDEPQLEPEPEDKIAPVITDVVIEGRRVAIIANEVDGTKYAITSSQVAPARDSTEWKESNVIAVSSDGTYYAWAIDKAGNISESRVVVINTTVPTASVDVETVDTRINKYIENGVSYVIVSPDVTESELRNKITVTNGDTSKLNIEYHESTNKFGTESVIKYDGNTKFIIVVKGDVNRDGEVKPIDVTIANRIRLNQIENVSYAQRLAVARVNNNNVVEPIDITRMNSYRLGKISI